MADMVELPEDDYVVIERDPDAGEALIAAEIGLNQPSDKHVYVVDIADLYDERMGSPPWSESVDPEFDMFGGRR